MFDVERWRRRWPWLDHALLIQKRFGDVGGGPHSSSIGLAGFLSLFPLLLVGIAVIGFVSSGNEDFATDLVADLGLEGEAAELITDAVGTAEGSRRTASIVGFVGLVWAGLGVVGALQAAVNAAWQTTGRGMRDKAVSLAWLAGAGVLFLATMAVGPALRVLPGPGVIAASLLSIAVTALIMVWAYVFLGNQPVPWRAHVVGAVIVAVGFEVLKLFGAFFVPRLVERSSALYGTIGVVFALLAYILLYARIFVYGAVVNVHLWERRAGTVSVQLEVPRFEGEVPVVATRGGAAGEPEEGAN